jgi:hypothetical protein
MKTINVALSIKALMEQEISVEIEDWQTFDDAVVLLLQNNMWHNDQWRMVDYVDSMPSIKKEV